MAAPRQPLNPATQSVGFHGKYAQVTAITADGLYAITVDRQFTETRVPMLVQRSKSPLPQVGETWLLDRAMGIWTFAAFVAQSSADFAGQPIPLDASDLIFIAGTAPDSPAVNDLWMNTAHGNELFRWDGTSWLALQFGPEALAPQSITAGKIAPGTITAAQISPTAGIKASQVAFTVSDLGGVHVFNGTDQPAGITNGDLWINPANGNLLSVWDGHTWHALQFGALAIAPASIGAAQVNFTASEIGGLNVAVGVGPPSSPQLGDLWYDATNGYVLDQWNGSAWVPYQYGTNAIQAGSVTAALIAANTITATQIAAGTITAGQIASGSITAGLIAAGAIDGLTINGNLINGATITTPDLLVSGASGGVFVYGTGATIVQLWNSAGATVNWTCPAGVTSVLAELWGAGGGGAYNNTSVGSGAAGGAYAATLITTVPGTVYTFVIGAKGNGGTSGTPTGTDGGDTTWMSTVIVAKGGGGAAPTSPGLHKTGSVGTTVFQGGDGSNGLAVGGPGGSINGGGGGGSAGPANTGINGFANGTGAPAVPQGGPGGDGASFNLSIPAAPGSAKPGGGGGGGCSGQPAGADGRVGQVRLTYTSGTPSLIGSIAGASGTDPVASVSYPEGAQFDNIRDSGNGGNRICAAQADNSTITVTQATPTAASAAYSIPANDAQVDTVYELWCGGNGTWGSTQQALMPDIAIDGAAISGSPVLDATTFNISEAFNWEFTCKIIIGTTGSGGTYKYQLKLSLSSNAHATQNGYTMIRRGGGLTLNTTISHTLGLMLSWASTTGAPTITNFFSEFQRKGP
jgi:hypothetical protein